MIETSPATGRGVHRTLQPAATPKESLKPSATGSQALVGHLIWI
jgi:hypothetical protein